MKIETLAVHGGYTPDPTTKAVAVPIYQTVAYAFDNTQHGADLFVEVGDHVREIFRIAFVVGVGRAVGLLRTVRRGLPRAMRQIG